MSDLQGQAVATQQANLDFCFGVASKMLEAAEQLTRLNLDLAKTTFADWHQRTQDSLTQTGERDASGLQPALALPSPENVTTYQRQMAEIAATTQQQLAEAVGAQCQQAGRQVQWLIDKLAQSAPGSSEATVAFLKQILALANAAGENVRRAVKQTFDLAQSHASVSTKAAAADVSEAAEQATGKAAKDTRQ